MALVLDAGALIAIDRRDRVVGARLRAAQLRRIPVHTSAAVLAQVWRDGARQVNLARVLAGITVHALDESAGQRVGELLSKTKTSDVCDGHVALVVSDGDAVVTSDPDDIRHLLDVRRVRASVVPA